MVWWGGGYLSFSKGALDFAGGTVVIHIASAWPVWVRSCWASVSVYGREAPTPYQPDADVMVGPLMLWWAGSASNAGSNPEAT